MGGWAKTPFFKETVLVGVCVVLVSLVPYGAGRPTTAVAIFVGGMVLLVAGTVLRFRRWPARTLTFDESIDLPHPCATVWNLIEPPEKAPLLDPTCFAGYRVPGTPAGVGAQHAHQHVNGMTTVLEVMEYEPGRRAKTRTVSPPGPVRSAPWRRSTRSTAVADTRSPRSWTSGPATSRCGPG